MSSQRSKLHTIVFVWSFGVLNNELPAGGFQRTIPRSNRLEILHMRFFLISDVLGTTVFARTHLGRSAINRISNDYFLFVWMIFRHSFYTRQL